jgi:hypothetical protein
MIPRAYIEYIIHLVELYGLPSDLFDRNFIFLYKSREEDVYDYLNNSSRKKYIIAIYPDCKFVAKVFAQADEFGTVTLFDTDSDGYCKIGGNNSFYPVKRYSDTLDRQVVESRSAAGGCFSYSVKIGDKEVIFYGIDLISDQIRFRQGDPESVAGNDDLMMWGIPGERPNYLFSSKSLHETPSGRPADEWMFKFVNDVALRTELVRSPLLPGNAKGAIVITGDDDQAELSKYDQQLNILGDLPITYFLHPKTRHTSKTLQAIQKGNPRVDLGIHPDALDEPSRYGELLDEQVDWFVKLTRQRPLSVRNHGFLNDGYWGHLDSWLKHGITISSNLPGYDGNIMNGSLLPARMVWNGELTSHWSILTAIGDGIRFAGGMSQQESADCLFKFASQIKDSGIPGVMVVNLHPQNVSETLQMHHAVKEIVASGFVAWNMRDCLNWFQMKEKRRWKVVDHMKRLFIKYK